MTRSEAFYSLGLKPWRNLVKFIHPDNDCSDDAAERFQKVQRAY